MAHPLPATGGMGLLLNQDHLAAVIIPPNGQSLCIRSSTAEAVMGIMTLTPVACCSNLPAIDQHPKHQHQNQKLTACVTHVLNQGVTYVLTCARASFILWSVAFSLYSCMQAWTLIPHPKSPHQV